MGIAINSKAESKKILVDSASRMIQSLASKDFYGHLTFRFRDGVITLVEKKQTFEREELNRLA